MLHYLHHHCHQIQTNAVVDVVVTESAPTEPVTLAQAKAWLRMENVSLDDALITELITEARKWIEKRCGISIVTKTVVAILEVMNELELPYGPIQDMTGITITDDDGEPLGNFTIVGLDGGFPVIRGYGRCTVSYEAGMTDFTEATGAMKSYIAFAYENRGDEIDESDEPFAKLARKKSNMLKRTIGF
jgi:hypothetical protein